ncbi:MAG: hypothetical protein CVV05_07625 [Gammaproteobacteria bacterium HGW-Gammaproteobacteria-1]|jgi:hypothetical protein|nr:MAG: hypothetical protein CVV05_07625 [Gammaproteobacteria bacterium HGW-Gammaproteobacteria-1]
MLLLPSGRVIDLSTDRARYHALRHPGVAPDAPHRELYALVDVLYRRRDDAGNPRRGWTEYDYEYSGYTLATLRLATDWSDADKTALYRWARQDTRRRQIETARRRLAPNQRQLSARLYSAPGRLYSRLRQRLAALPLARADAVHWLATINNMTRHGVRDEEIQWSGVRDYLARQPAGTVLGREQVLAAVDFSNIRLELNTEQVWGVHGGLSFREMVLRMPHQAVYRAALKLDRGCLCIQRYVDDAYNYRVGVVKTRCPDHPMALNKYWFALDPYGRAVPNTETDGSPRLFFDSSVDAKLAADRHAHQHLGIRSGASTHTRFDHLTLCGGRDYREWIVSLPDYQRTFFGAHFYDHNVLVHIRTTTRSDLAGRKLLFIEEIQSDWHQSGRRDGYDTSWWGQVANAPYKKDWPVLAAKLMLIQTSENGYAGIAWPPGDIQELRYMRALHAIRQHYDRELPQALNRLGRLFGCTVESTCIPTREPWLNMQKREDKWCVADGQGKFRTKARYSNRDEAMAVIALHSREMDLPVPVFFIGDDLRRQIAERGLPLFGERF